MKGKILVNDVSVSWLQCIKLHLGNNMPQKRKKQFVFDRSGSASTLFELNMDTLIIDNCHCGLQTYKIAIIAKIKPQEVIVPPIFHPL